MSDEEDNYQEDVEMYDDYEDDLSLKPQFSMSDEYELLKEGDFITKRQDQITEFQEFSSLSRDEAEIVLINFNWNYEKLTTVWYENPELYMVKCGIKPSAECEKKLKEFKNSSSCLVCYEDFGPDCKKIGLKCGHFFCESCFFDYLKNMLENDPLLVISAKCPQEGCNLICTHSIFDKLLSREAALKKKLETFMIKNYTDSNSDIKSCPNPKCDVIVRVPGHGMKEIKCTCGQVFCFKCLKESHRPCDCEMAEIWEKNNSDSDTNNIWLKAYTKQCPNCKKHIEKNQGCSKL